MNNTVNINDLNKALALLPSAGYHHKTYGSVSDKIYVVSEENGKIEHTQGSRFPIYEFEFKVQEEVHSVGSGSYFSWKLVNHKCVN